MLEVRRLFAEKETGMEEGEMGRVDWGVVGREEEEGWRRSAPGAEEVVSGSLEVSPEISTVGRAGVAVVVLGRGGVGVSSGTGVPLSVTPFIPADASLSIDGEGDLLFSGDWSVCGCG